MSHSITAKAREISEDEAISLLLDTKANAHLGIYSGSEMLIVPEALKKEFLQLHTDFFTTTKAAKILGVSRQYLSVLLDREVLPSIAVGTHRRIEKQALLAYKEKRAKGIEALYKNTQDLGGYENSPDPAEFSREL
jgi:excisionase family DNA binding protein